MEAVMVDQISANTDVASVASQAVARPEIAAKPEIRSIERPDAEPVLSPEEVDKILEVANAALKSANNSLRFRLDDSIDRPIVTVVDEESGSVVRQLPSEEVVRIARSIDSMRGVIFDSIV
jgi:flagellar protein FlaG